MHASFAALLEQPGARRYKQLRSQCLASETYSDFARQLAQLEHQLALPQVESNLLIGELLRVGLLSLRLHRLGGQSALAQGNEDRAQLHRFTYDALVTAILSTGNGTRQKPLLVTYASDSREVLAARSLMVVSQSLVEDLGRRFDVLLADDEREFWFDVTDLLPHTASVVPAPAKPVRSTRKQSSKRSAALSRT